MIHGKKNALKKNKFNFMHQNHINLCHQIQLD